MRHHERPQKNRNDTPRKLTQNEFLSWIIPAARGVEIPPLESKLESELDPAFLAIGTQVAAAKQQLDDIPPAEFTKLMRGLDLYADLKRQFRNDYKMAISTNASLKLFEMITQLHLLPREGACETAPRVRAFCNAELPGAFIVAINHFVRTTCPSTDMDWVASSYLPEAAKKATGKDETTILGDQYGLYARNRAHWLMGPKPNAMPEGEPPLSGDVTSADVVAALADAVHARFTSTTTAASGATHYTSDAGIDISEDFAREEELTSLVNYGQVLSGILALAPGGCLVTKQFTFTHLFSRSLIALLASLFDELRVVKPLTSRPGNSEVYLVGKGFQGIAAPLANALLDRLAGYAGKSDAPCASAPLLDPAAFADADAVLLRVARQVHGRQQVAFLNEAVSVYHLNKNNLGGLVRIYQPLATKSQRSWLAENPARRIRDDAQLESKASAGVRGGECGAAAECAAPLTPLAPLAPPPALVRIIAKRQRGGIAVDAAVLKEAIQGSEIVNAISFAGRERTADIQFHLEHYYKEFPGKVNYLVVNQEFLTDWDIDALSKGLAVALCKTHFAKAFLAEKFDIDSVYLGFSSPEPPLAASAKPARPFVLHIAGESPLKGTLEVMHSWTSKGGYQLDADLLIVRRPADYERAPPDFAFWKRLAPQVVLEFMAVGPVERVENVYLVRRPLSVEEHGQLMRAAAVVLCPSLVEGFGHTINQARALAKVIVTTDAAPMNELVDEKSGFLVCTTKNATTMAALNPTQARFYPAAVAEYAVAPVDEAKLIVAVKNALAAEPRVGVAARARFEADAAHFKRTISEFSR